MPFWKAAQLKHFAVFDTCQQKTLPFPDDQMSHVNDVKDPGRCDLTKHYFRKINTLEVFDSKGREPVTRTN